MKIDPALRGKALTARMDELAESHHEELRGQAQERETRKSQAELTLYQLGGGIKDLGYDINHVVNLLGELETSLAAHLRPPFSNLCGDLDCENDSKEEPAESEFVVEVRKLRDANFANRKQLTDIIQNIITFQERLVIP